MVYEGGGDRIILIYGDRQSKRAELLRAFFEGMGLRVVLKKSSNVDEIGVEYNGVYWEDPGEAVRYITGVFIRKGLI